MTRKNWLTIILYILISSLIFSACGQEAIGEQVTDQITQSPEPISIQPSPTPTPKTFDIANNEQNVIVFGEDPWNLTTGFGDELGLDVAATGDFNGDGIKDILLAANGSDGPQNGRDHAGECYVIFGNTNLPSQVDVAQVAGSGVDIRIFGMETGIVSTLPFAVGDNLGETVTTGDVNGDEYDDIILASTLADGPNNKRPDSGEVYIIFGRSQEDWDLMRPSPNEPIDFDVKGVAGPEPDVFILGADKEDLLGCSMSTGYVSGDSFADLLLGACYADGPANGRIDAGEAYILFGRTTEEWKAISPIDLKKFPNLADVTFYGADIGDMLGSAIASSERSWDTGPLPNTSNVNGDYLDDILIGARHADGQDNAKPDAGEVYLFFGPGNYGTTPKDLSTSIADLTIFGADAGDNLSSFLGLAMGDVDGDTLADILIGAPLAAGEGNNKPGSGEVYIIPGRSGGFSVYAPQFGKDPSTATATATVTTTIDLSTASSDIMWQDVVTIYGVDPDDWLGSSLACGDLNQDGIDEVIIGAPGGDGPGNVRPDRAGEAYVVFTFPTKKNVDLASPDSAYITIYGAETDDNFGYSISCGNVNGDQFDDILVGAPYAFGPGNSRGEAGEAYVIFGP